MLILLRLFFLIGLLGALLFYALFILKGQPKYQRWSFIALVATAVAMVVFFGGLILENILFPGAV